VSVRPSTGNFTPASGSKRRKKFRWSSRATTDLIGILPAQVFAAASGSLSVLDPDDPSSLYSYVHAIWPRNRILSPSAIKALDLAKKIAQD